MRGGWLAALLFLAVPAQGALTLTAEAPAEPVPLDGTAKVVVTVVVDCIDLAPRIPYLDIPLAVSAPGLAFDGPAQVRADLLDCRGVPPAWTGVAEYAVSGSRYLPGLVAIPGNASAALYPPPHPLFEVADAHAGFQVVPEAILDDDFAELRMPPTVTSGAIDLPASLVSRSNVDVALGLTWAGKESLSHDGPSAAQLALPRGALAAPATLLLPRATGEATPGKATLLLLYTGAAGHAGRDRFHLVAQGSPLADPTLQTRSEAMLEVPYDLQAPAEDGRDGASKGRVGAELAPITSRAAPAAGVAALALLAACALAARSRPGRRA